MSFPLYSNIRHTGDFSLNYKDLSVKTGPKGTTTHFRVQCPDVLTLIAYRNFIVQFGAQVDANGFDSGETRELTVELPGLLSTLVGTVSELFFDSWELMTNEGSQTIFRNPRIVSSIGGAQPVLNYNNRCVLSYLARNGGTPAQAIGAMNGMIGLGVTAPTIDNGGTLDGKFQAPAAGTAANQLLLNILKGQTEYEAPQYVLRHTSYCSPGISYNSGVNGAQMLYSPGKLLTEISSGWTYNCPYRYTSKIANIPQQYAASDEASFFLWGWLKKITREPQLANFMIEISTEYSLDLWPTTSYAIY
jgi:hypothetical protein